MAHNFQKILAPYKRLDPNSKTIDIGQWAKSEFELLKDVEWEWTEKIDGTSIGIRWDGERISFVGHTDRAEISPILLKWLTEYFKTEEMEEVFETLFGEKPVTVYGEGLSKEYPYHYGYVNGGFVMYDIQNDENGSWFPRKDVYEYAKTLGLLTPKVICIGQIQKAINTIMNHPKSELDPTWYMEGLVGRPVVELMCKGDRVITKVKYKDFTGENYRV